MARSSRPGNRGTAATSRPSGLVSGYVPSYGGPGKYHLKEWEDRRTYHPEGRFRPAMAVPKSARIMVDRPVTKKHTKLSDRLYKNALRGFGKIAFRDPARVLLCIRRKERREVLHALNRTSPGRGKKKRKNFWSAIRC